MVTKEEVEKARVFYCDASDAAIAEEAAARRAAEASDRAVQNSWRHYQKLKEEYENGKG